MKSLICVPIPKSSGGVYLRLHLQLRRSFSFSFRCCSSRRRSEHATLLVDTFSHQRSFKALQKRLTRHPPLTLLQQDGDWTSHHFWAVVRFLTLTSRPQLILQIFDAWKSVEESRRNELNYSKIIKVLAEEGLVEEAALSFEEMKSLGLALSLDVYNAIIHAFARKGNFHHALSYLAQMHVSPEAHTYDGLIQAYAKHQMYDEIETCLRKMKSNGVPPDHITYNLLLTEYSRGGLLRRMESTYHAMVSKRMLLHSSTLLAMLHTYATFRILDKMDKFYHRALSLRIPLGDELITKFAEVYIENYMFSKLETMGREISAKFGEIDLLWCLRLLSHACVGSKKGMDSVLAEMEEAQIPWSVTIANVICLTHLKMNNFTHLRISLSEMTNILEPDMITVGVLFDAIDMGFDGTRILQMWHKMEFFYKGVEMNTKPVVLIAFGKGKFLRNCEDTFSSLTREDRDGKTWNYQNLIELVSRHKQS